MSVTTLHGREPSPEFLEEVPDYDTPVHDMVDVDVATAAKWAADNKVNTAGPGSPIARINTARFSKGLPMFNIISTKAGSTVTPARKPALVVPTSRPMVTSLATSRATLLATTPDLPSYHDPSLRIIKTEAEFLELVRSHNGTVTVLCTPELAGWLMAINTGNRPKSDKNVDRFGQIIRSGHWKLTGEPIIVSKEGQLNDGQHRLAAVIEIGVAVPLDLRFGISRDAFEATGTGARRTLGNVLAIAGHKNSTLLAAIARLLHHYDARTMASATQQVEAHLLLSIIDGEPDMSRVASWLATCNFKPIKVSPFGMVLNLAARAVGVERATQFAEAVAAGQSESTNPARCLHVRLRDAAFKRERLSQAEVAALSIRAWNYWIQGRPMQQLRIHETDRTSAGFPVVADPSSVASGGAG